VALIVSEPGGYRTTSTSSRSRFKNHQVSGCGKRFVVAVHWQVRFVQIQIPYCVHAENGSRCSDLRTQSDHAIATRLPTLHWDLQRHMFPGWSADQEATLSRSSDLGSRWLRMGRPRAQPPHQSRGASPVYRRWSRGCGEKPRWFRAGLPHHAPSRAGYGDCQRNLCANATTQSRYSGAMALGNALRNYSIGDCRF
jgi:hypothetical protein